MRLLPPSQDKELDKAVSEQLEEIFSTNTVLLLAGKAIFNSSSNEKGVQEETTVKLIVKQSGSKHSDPVGFVL